MEKDLDDGVYDEYDEQAYAADVQVGAAVIDLVKEIELRQEDEEYFVIPWKEHRSSKDREIAHRSFLLMQGNKLSMTMIKLPSAESPPRSTPTRSG